MNIKQILKEEILKANFNQKLVEGYEDVPMDYIKSRKKLSEYTSYNDKIIIGDYTYLNIVSKDDEWYLWGKIMVFDNEDGTEVAHVSYGKVTEASDMKATIDVRPDKRRMGIASNIYQWVEKLTGFPLYPDTPHTKAAEALWSNPKRKFGFDKLKEEMGKSQINYTYTFDENGIVLACDIPNDDRETIEKNIKRNERGQQMGGVGGQGTELFGSLEAAQAWFDARKNKNLQKATSRPKYPVLSKIAYNLRINKEIDVSDINRGSCFMFALLLNKYQKINNFTFVYSEEEMETIHVYTKLDKNLYFDANGFHTLREIKSDYEIGEENSLYDGDITELNHFEGIDGDSSLTTIPISAKDWQVITNIVKNS